MILCPEDGQRPVLKQVSLFTTSFDFLQGEVKLRKETSTREKPKGCCQLRHIHHPKEGRK